MSKVVDVVNFNADASCLSSRRWLETLNGGKKSYFYRWLDLNVKHNKKVVMGFSGATVADIKSFNPESIDLVNSNPEIFEILIRSFAHDNALLRHRESFLINIDYGAKTISKEFDHVSDYFLPPEFMCTNEQVKLLADRQVNGIFINPDRFSEEIKARIPNIPYKLTGLFDCQMNCIPFLGELTQDYLHALHFFDCEKWNNTITRDERSVVFSWRDGESSFFIPNGIEREEYWLANESKSIERCFLGNLNIDFEPARNFNEQMFTSYPVHSFSAWMDELRMLGYIHRLDKIENNLKSLKPGQVLIWLQAINSDILSAVEKESPVLKLRTSENDDSVKDFTLWRSERGFEGEELLSLIEFYDEQALQEYLGNSQNPHIERLRARMEYLKEIN